VSAAVASAEAALARAHGRDPAAMAGRLAIGHAAATTAGNAAETAAWVAAEAASGRPVRTLRVVTAAYHMPRARAELEARLPEEVMIVTDGVRAGLPLAAMLVEYAKFQASWVMLRVRPS
jgi:uncharacterized SAM-binding protein YcdF (DUF218 family)